MSLPRPLLRRLRHSRRATVVAPVAAADTPEEVFIGTLSVAALAVVYVHANVYFWYMCRDIRSMSKELRGDIKELRGELRGELGSRVNTMLVLCQLLLAQQVRLLNRYLVCIPIEYSSHRQQA